jgi:hypothetical protein
VPERQCQIFVKVTCTWVDVPSTTAAESGFGCEAGTAYPAGGETDAPLTNHTSCGEFSGIRGRTAAFYPVLQKCIPNPHPGRVDQTDRRRMQMAPLVGAVCCLVERGDSNPNGLGQLFRRLIKRYRTGTQVFATIAFEIFADQKLVPSRPTEDGSENCVSGSRIPFSSEICRESDCRKVSEAVTWYQ